MQDVWQEAQHQTDASDERVPHGTQPVTQIPPRLQVRIATG